MLEYCKIKKGGATIMKKLKIVVCILILVVMMLSLIACTPVYQGLHRELYVVAVNNIFGAHGYSGHGEHHYDSQIDMIEVDDYGRILFFYNEQDSVGGLYHTAIVIMQYTDRYRNYVYYYQDDCYWPYFGEETPYPAAYRNLFSEEEIDALKELNDWNKKIDLKKCAKASCKTLRPDGALDIKDEEMSEIVKSTAQKLGYNKDDVSYSYDNEFCNADKYGRELYYVSALVRSSSADTEKIEFAMIFNPDKTCPEENVYVLTDKALTFDALKVLKQNVGWNQPYTANK